MDSQTQASKYAQPFMFLHLPADVRIRILQYALTYGNPLCSPASLAPKDISPLVPLPRLRPSPSIIFISHQLHEEGLAVLCEVNMLSININDIIDHYKEDYLAAFTDKLRHGVSVPNLGC